MCPRRTPATTLSVGDASVCMRKRTALPSGSSHRNPSKRQQPQETVLVDDGALEVPRGCCGHLTREVREGASSACLGRLSRRGVSLLSRYRTAASSITHANVGPVHHWHAPAPHHCCTVVAVHQFPASSIADWTAFLACSAAAAACFALWQTWHRPLKWALHVIALHWSHVDVVASPHTPHLYRASHTLHQKCFPR